MYSRASSGPRVRAQEGIQCTRMCHLDHLWLYYPSHFKKHDAIEKNVKILFLKLNWLEFILQLENFCNLIGFEQWYFSLIWNTKPFVGSSSIKIIAWFVRDIWHLWYFKIVSYFTHLTAGEISYNNFNISHVVFMPNITTNHAISYANIFEFPISLLLFLEK